MVRDEGEVHDPMQPLRRHTTSPAREHPRELLSSRGGVDTHDSEMIEAQIPDLFRIGVERVQRG